MPSRRRRKKKKSFLKLEQLIDRNESFLMRMTSTYLYRHLRAYPRIELEEEFFELLCMGLKESLSEILDRTLEQFDREKREGFAEVISKAIDSQRRFNDIIPIVFERTPKIFQRKFNRTLLEVLEERIKCLGDWGQSDLEKNLQAIKKMFSLTDQERDFALFLYISYADNRLENFFVDHLRCQKLTGRRFLAKALAMTKNQLQQALTGTLRKIGFFELDSSSLEIDHDFLSLFEDPLTNNITEKFYRKISRNAIPLAYHLTVQKELGQVLELLRNRPKTSTQILLYGPAGTGKSSFAQGLAKELAGPAYEIAKDDDNISKNRRAGILACLNMTNGGDGSLILVDEADNILNTRFAWFFRGETQDKGWLNQLLEEPGARMIWITNNINHIEPSVLRRFAFSLHFRPFNKRQRMLLWGNILRKNRAKRFFSEKEIKAFAGKFRVSAGAIDLAVKKAIEANPESKGKFQRIIETALEAHQILLNGGQKAMEKDRIEENYSIEGLNVTGNLPEIISQLEKFDHYLRTTDQAKVANINLLFHGPSGSGKSELARYLGERLDREILSKRVSDLQSKWVGESEKNIKAAFEEAEREEAILIMDEADSLLFNRDRAIRSWETSFTNEFLTRMERFRGILICTTNRLKDLDQASIRRFQQKLGFDYLKPEGNIIFYKRLLAGLIDGPIDNESKTSLGAITALTPGDFKTVRDRYSFHPREELTHKILVETLRDEAQIKKLFNRDQSIGF